MDAIADSVTTAAERHPVPYYGSYASFMRALKVLKEQGIPKRMTPRSLMPLLGDEGPRLSTHFVSMGWVESDRSTAEFERLVKSFGEEAWKETLLGVVRRVYAFVPEPWSDLTKDVLHKAFLSHTGRDAKVMSSAETFFLALAMECGIQLEDRLYLRAARAHTEAAKRSKLEVEEPGDVAVINVSARANKTPSPKPKDLEDATSTELKRLDVISAHLEQINAILKLSMLLGDATLTDDERKAVGITISVLGRKNAP